MNGVVWRGEYSNRSSDFLIPRNNGQHKRNGSYINEILRPHVIQMRRRMSRDFILMQSDARAHGLAHDYLKVNNIITTSSGEQPRS